MNLLTRTGFDSLFEESADKPNRSQLAHRENERSNLLAITRLILRSFLEQCMSTNNRVIESDIQPLCDLLMMLEKVFWHGFKSISQKSVLFLKSPDAELWSMIAKISRSSEAMKETVSCVDHIDSLRLPICKVRAFLRISVMQKKLSEFFTIITNSPLLKDYYETWALVRHENIIHISGGLLGLTVLDCNLSLSQEHLHDLPLSVDLTPYIKLPSISSEANGDQPNAEALKWTEEKKRLLDQNSYLEERTRQLTCNIENMKRRLDSVDSGNESQRGVILMEQEMVSFRPLESDEKDSNSTDSGAEETEKQRLLHQISEKDDNIRLLKDQLAGVKTLNADLYTKVRHAEDCCRQLEKDFMAQRERHLNECERNLAVVKKLEDKVADLNEEIETRNMSDDSVRLELHRKCEQYSDIHGKLETKQEELAASQKEAHKLRTSLEKVHGSLAELSGVKQDFEELQKQHEAMSKRALEAEHALEEMGGKLSETKLRIIELAEELFPLTEAQWAKDADVHNCSACADKFTLAKRKHHCRMCGSIFCSPCSEARVKLPSSAKPARVCDKCFTILGNRHTSHTNVPIQ